MPAAVHSAYLWLVNLLPARQWVEIGILIALYGLLDTLRDEYPIKDRGKWWRL